MSHIGNNHYYDARTGRMHADFDRDSFAPAPERVGKGVVCVHTDTSWDGARSIIGLPEDVAAYCRHLAREAQAEVQADEAAREAARHAADAERQSHYEAIWLAYGAHREVMIDGFDGTILLRGAGRGGADVVIGLSLADAARRTTTTDAARIRAALA